MIFIGYRTKSAALHALAKNDGEYRWWGVTVGQWFFGCVVRRKVTR